MESTDNETPNAEISDEAPAKTAELASADPAPAPLPPPPLVNSTVERILALPASQERDNVLANYRAGSYGRGGDLEADIAELRRKPE